MANTLRDQIVFSVRENADSLQYQIPHLDAEDIVIVLHTPRDRSGHIRSTAYDENRFVLSIVGGSERDFLDTFRLVRLEDGALQLRYEEQDIEQISVTRYNADGSVDNLDIEPENNG